MDVYRLCRGFLRGVFALFLPVRAKGLEYVPEAGPVLLCANHQSLTDPMAICCVIQRKVHFMAKKELFSVLGLGDLLRALGAFPVDRGAGDLSAVRRALSILNGGNALGIFPQGTRAWKNPASLQNGAALLALKSGAEVVPVFIEDRARLFHPIRLHFGKSVCLKDLHGATTSQALAQATQRMEQAIFSLKPH